MVKPLTLPLLALLLVTLPVAPSPRPDRAAAPDCLGVYTYSASGYPAPYAEVCPV